MNTKRSTDKGRQDYNYKVLVDGEVTFATDDYQKAQNFYTRIINSSEPLFMYEVNLVINFKWLSYTEEGVRVEGRFVP